MTNIIILISRLIIIINRDSSDLRYGDEFSHRGPREGYGQQYTKSPNKPTKKIEKKINTNSSSNKPNANKYNPKSSSVSSSTKEDVMMVNRDAPASPCEAMTPKEKLYFSKEPREVEYKPYTLSQYKLVNV